MRRRTRIALIFVIALLFILLVLPFLLPLDTSGSDPRVFADINGRFIEVDGLETYLVELGDSNAPAVVFLHGLYGSTWVWRNNLDVLAEAGYHVIAFDRPGTGLSDKPSAFNYSHTNNADFTAHLMDALSLTQAVIVGQSAGGNVAAHFALIHPERVDRLILVDAAILGVSGPPAFVGGILAFSPISRWAQIAMPLLVTESSVRSTVASFHADPGFLTETDFAGYWRGFQTPGWTVGLLGLTRDTAGNNLSEEQIAGIGASTLILWGESDGWTPLANGQALANLIPNSRLITYADIGHQPMEENAEQFNADVIAFLDTSQ